MRKLLLLIFLFLIVGVTSAQKIAGDFVLKGIVEKPNGTEVALRYEVIKDGGYSYENQMSTVVDNSFSFSGYLTEPTVGRVKIDGEELNVAMGADEMQLSIKDMQKEDYTLEGGTLQKHWMNIKAVQDQAQKLLDEAKENGAEEHVLDSLFNLVRNYDLIYLKENPDYIISFQSLRFDMQAGNVKIISIEEARRLFEDTPVAFRNTHTGKVVRSAIESQENTQIGSLAPNFSVEDVNGNIVTLSDFRNKEYVLLDVWASWCSPCIEGLPHIKEVYKTYHDKGLAVIAISRDHEKKAWQNAIEKYGLQDFYNILAEKEPGTMMKGVFVEDDIFSLYPIIAVPKYYLIDKEGVIIGVWSMLSEKNFEEMDKLLEDIFKD